VFFLFSLGSNCLLLVNDRNTGEWPSASVALGILYACDSVGECAKHEGHIMVGTSQPGQCVVVSFCVPRPLSMFLKFYQCRGMGKRGCVRQIIQRLEMIW
jgi:hypothetical protein